MADKASLKTYLVKKHKDSFGFCVKTDFQILGTIYCYCGKIGVSVWINIWKILYFLLLQICS